MIVMIMMVKRVKDRLYNREPQNERQTGKERNREREDTFKDKTQNACPCGAYTPVGEAVNKHKQIKYTGCQIVMSSKEKKLKQERGIGSDRGDTLNEVASPGRPPWKGEV